MSAAGYIIRLIFTPALCITAAYSQQIPREQPTFIEQGRQLTREGRLDDALSLYRTILKTIPGSLPAHTEAGIVLDFMGKGEEARQHFQKAIDLAPGAFEKANAQRDMAMSWAFTGDCGQSVRYEQTVLQYYVNKGDFYQQGQVADEAARVCLDHGQLDTAYQWYLTGHDLGLKQPDITPERKDLWEFRWEHAQARIAARKGNQTEADKHVAAAKAILDNNAGLARAQGGFFPYLLGYVALKRSDNEAALEQLQKADQNDPFVQCLLGDAYEALRQRDKAFQYYQNAASATGHNPAAAFARPYAARKLTGWANKKD